MLQKTMNSVLTKKVNQWLESITDESVVKAIKKDLIITGGCFTSMIQNEKPHDFDCYFMTKETLLIVANYYAKLWNEAHVGQTNKLGLSCNVMVLDGANPSDEIKAYYGKINKNAVEDQATGSVLIDNCTPDRVKMIFPSDGYTGDVKAMNPEEVVEGLDEIPTEEVEKERTPYTPVFITTNAITLSDGIQIVVRFYGDPATIHDTYDFVHTKCYWTSWDGEVVIPNEAYDAIVNKTLIYTGSKYPVCSMFRVRKFVQRGWNINAGQILKMALQISELDLLDINVLEDQLIGVDSAYFMLLIAQFREQQKNNPDFQLTQSYVVSIVDKIF